MKLLALSAVELLFARLCAPVFYIAHALVLVGCRHVRYTATVMCGTRACLLGHLAASDGTCTGHFGWRKKLFRLLNNLPILPCPEKHVITESHLRGMLRDWLRPHILIPDGARGASRSFQCHEWDEDASRGSPSARGVQPETWADAEVKIVDERDIGQGKAATTDATDRMAADATGSSTGDAATEEEAVKRRLGELYRLLNSRNGSLNATYRKNAEANDMAHDLSQKSIQALDALAKGICGLRGHHGQCHTRARGRRHTACSDSGSGRRARTNLERARPSLGRSGELERRTNCGNQKLH